MTSFLHGTGVAKADRAGGGSLRRIILSTTAIAALAYGMSGQSGWSQDLIINDASTPNPTVFDSDQTFDTITVEDGGNATSGYFVFDAPVTVTANDALILNSTETHTVGAGEVLNAGTATIKSDLNISNGGTFSVTEGLETLGTVEIAGSSTANALTVNGGTLSVTPDGDLTVTGATDIGAGAFSNDGEFGTGSLTVTSETGSFDNTGTATVTNDFTDETVGNTVTNTGTLNIGGTMTVDGAVSQSGSGVITATTGASLGSLSLSDMSEFASDGEVTLGTLNAGSQTSLSGASITLTGDGTLDGTITGDLEVSDTTEDGSALSVSNGGTIEDDLTLSATTTAETDGVIFTNDNTIKGNVTVGTGSADSTNLTLINTNLIEGDITSYGVVQSAGQVDGDVTANAGTLEFADGASVGGTVTVGDAATLSLGTYGNSGGPAVIITGDLVADGDISSTGANALAIDGTFSSSGTIKADTGEASITAGTINLRDGTVLSEVNGGTLSFSADAINYGIAKTITDPTLNYDLGVIDGATVTIASELNGDGHDLNVTDGTLSVDADTTQIGVTTVASDGIVTVGSGIELEFSSLTNDGTVNLGESATLTGTGNTYTNNGTTNVSDNATIQDAGAIENSGLLRFEGSATLNSDTNSSGGEIITNTGTLDLTTLTNADPTVDALDDLTSTGGSALIQLAEDTELTVAGTLTNADGASVTIGTDATVSASDDVVNTSGSTITVGMDGTLSATNGVLNDDTATLDVNGGTVSGALDNSATVTFAGTMTGNVANTGVFTVDGDSTMAGDFDNEDGGTLTVNEDLTGITTLTNTGTDSTVTVGSGATLGATSLVNELTATLDVNGGTVSGALDNSATVTFAGTMTGDVANTGSFTIDGDSTMAGDFDNEDGGTLTVNEDLTGITTLTNAGAGSTVTVGGGATLGATSLVNELTATLDVNGGTVSGALDNSATVTFAGTMTGDVANTGSFTIDGDSTMAGDFDNEDGGTLTVNEDLTGITTLTNAGAGSTVTVGGGATLGTTNIDNSATFSSLNNSVVSTGTFDNETGGFFTNAGDFDATGAVTNDNQITNTSTGTFDADALTNSGTFTNTGGVVGATDPLIVQNSGTISNQGTGTFGAVTVNNTTGGVVTNASDATMTMTALTNAATVTNQGMFTAEEIETTGTFTNTDGTVTVTGLEGLENGGTLTNQSDGVVTTTLLDNSGNLSNLDTSVFNAAEVTNGGPTASLVNQGDFNVTGMVSNTGSITTSGTFDSGLLQNYLSFVNDGGTVGGTAADAIDNDGTLTNQNAGVLNATDIDNNGSFSNLDTSVVNTATFDNEGAGSLVNQGDFNASGAVTNLNSINNTGTFDAASIDNDATFVNNGGTVGGTTAGSIDSSDTLTNQNDAELTATTITNSGTLSNLDTSSVTATTSVTNTGSITSFGAFDTAALDNDMTFVNDGGTVGGTTPGSIDNDGTLTNQNAGVLTATDIDNNGSFSNLDTSIINTATFDNEGAGSLVNQGDLNASGAVTNLNSINNTGTFDAASIDNDATFVNNGGTVGGTTAGSIDSSDTLTNQNDAELTATTITNSGTLSNLDTSSVTATTSVTNTGSITSFGTFDTAALDNDMTFVNDGGTVGGTTPGSIDNDGTLTNQNAAELTATDIDNNGSFSNLDTSVVNTATFDNEGAGSLVNQGDFNASGAVTNLNSINNTGTFDAASIDNDATFVNNGGIVGGTTPGSIDTSGTLTNQTAGVIFATDIDNSGTMSNLDTSTVNGSTFDNVGSTSQLTNAGTMTLTGAATNEGNIDNTGAFTALSFDNDGSVDNDGTFTAPVDNSGSFDNSGTVIGAVSNSGGFDNTGGITGDVDNDATGDFDHDGTITGDVSNSGAFQMAGMIDGDFDNFADGTFTIDGNSTIDGALDNMGTLENDGSGLTLAVTDGFINTGTIQSLDMFTIDTASIDNTSGRIDLGTDDAADDVLVLTGTVAGGTLAFDIDLGDSTGATDQIVLSSLTGNVLLEFDTLDSGAILNDPLQVVDGNAVSALLTSTGLPARSGPLSYQVTQSSEGVFVNSVIDPGAAAVSGNLALVQSLIGTIVNRPSSPFVSGLAYESEDTCGSGAWARATGGRAEATSRTDNGQASLPATVDADFYGFVTGYDFGCFNSAGGEWDVAVGGILGINSGSTEQKVFEVGVSGADIVLTDNQISTTRSDFDQRYVGGYVAAARGAFTGDVQLRFENTDYEFDNESLGLYDEETSSNGTTLSASISYSHALSDTLTFVPTAGFGITRTSTDDLVFRDNSGTEIGRIDFDDHTTKIGFVGGTLAHTTIAPSGTEAYNSFVTATYYEDFSDDMTSKYRIGNDSQDLSTDPLGGFGELSVGLSYIKILDGEVGAAKQFNASVRADARFSDDVEAFSITAQARLQF